MGLLPIRPAELMLFYTGADILRETANPEELNAPTATFMISRAESPENARSSTQVE
jgi:hypothetical protein